MGSTDLAQGEDWVNGGHLVFQWVIAVTTLSFTNCEFKITPQKEVWTNHSGQTLDGYHQKKAAWKNCPRLVLIRKGPQLQA